MTERAKTIEQMARNHAAAWTQNRPDQIGELFAENGEISVNGAPPHKGRPAIIENAKGLLATFPGLTVHCHETRQTGDRAVFIWTLEGRHGETGNSVSLPGWHEWELDEDNKVVRRRGFYDADDLQRQIQGS